MRGQSDNETLEEFGSRVSVFELSGVINFIGSNFITRSVAEADFQDFIILSFIRVNRLFRMFDYFLIRFCLKVRE